MNEFKAFLELLGMLFSDPRTGVLLALLAAAAACDRRTYRIPNLVTGGGILFALAYNTAVPPSMVADWTWAPAGMLLGLVALLPMYAIGAMGAGDVKLMAMAGAFLGPQGTIWALLFSGAAGGIAALAFALRKRMLARMLTNTGDMLRGMLWSAVAGNGAALQPARLQSVGRLAYGISIACGTTAYVVAHQFGLI
ncbi:MAG: A24 family peptidase [Telluria sp.]